jgi:ATP-dependent exoDNAse (exonuclease V) alpha subunit
LLDCDGLQQKVRVTRNQIPIQPAFTITGHSLQGKTLPNVIVNLHEGSFAAYVAALCA